MFGPKVDPRDRYHVLFPRLVRNVVSFGWVRSQHWFSNSEVGSYGLVVSLAPKVVSQVGGNKIRSQVKVSGLVFKVGSQSLVLMLVPKIGSKFGSQIWSQKLSPLAW